MRKNHVWNRMLLVLMCVTLIPIIVNASIPDEVTFQGVLKDSGGNPLTGSYNLSIKLYTVSSGGTAIWNKNYSSVAIDNGLFSCVLNDLASVNFELEYWLGVTINSGTELTPRTKLEAVPYALIAQNVADGAITPDKISTSGASSGQALVYNGSSVDWETPSGSTSPWTYYNDNIRYKNGNVGIGPNMDSPMHPFHVVSSETSVKLGVGHFVNNNITEVDAAAVSGWCESVDYFGYGGYFKGGYCGVGGISQESGSNTYIGVSGIAINTNTEATLYGVYGRSSNSSNNPNSFAGYFNGNVNITGNLSKGGGSFLIDHPLDPENKYLYHSFVESPDMMNVYNGNVVLDNNGEAVVELPEYFEALNKEFRYQLTCIGGYAPVYIKEKIQNNKLLIGGGNPGLEISWQVTGIRQDPYANAHRIETEVEKSVKDRGYYLHYEEYNQPVEKSIESIRTHKAFQESNK